MNRAPKINAVYKPASLRILRVRELPNVAPPDRFRTARNANPRRDVGMRCGIPGIISDVSYL